MADTLDVGTNLPSEEKPTINLALGYLGVKFDVVVAGDTERPNGWDGGLYATEKLFPRFGVAELIVQCRPRTMQMRSQIPLR